VRAQRFPIQLAAWLAFLRRDLCCHSIAVTFWFGKAEVDKTLADFSVLIKEDGRRVNDFVITLGLWDSGRDWACPALGSTHQLNLSPQETILRLRSHKDT
jgi:hypothetical protein